MALISRIVERYGKQKYLAVSLVVYLLADALFPDTQILMYSILALMIITGPLAVGKSPRHQVLVIGLAVLMVSLGFVGAAGGNETAAAVGMLAGALFFGALIYLITRELMFEVNTVSAETLWAAINVYVLMGVLFAFLYTFVAAVEPEAFTGDVLLGDGRFSGQTFIYFSYVTMTTLGYGDITPNIQISATLVYVQALIGQLYVAIMIARLVALYSTQNNKE